MCFKFRVEDIISTEILEICLLSSASCHPFRIFLKLISTPASWKSAGIRVKLYIKETNKIQIIACYTIIVL